jgi:hypothetical protein
MQNVSTAYKESMKSSLRERGFIMIVFGLINQEAQSHASITDGEFTYYSNESSIFNRDGETATYATLESGFTRVDGSMIFLPRENNTDAYIDTGLIGKGLVSDMNYELVMHLNIPAIDLQGITIDFGVNYPVNFDIVGSTGQIIEVRANTQSVFKTNEILENTTLVELIIYTMRNLQSRLRIYSVQFGYGLVYQNDSVISSTLDSYVSPIGADIPQIDFSVTLKNYDKFFDLDNPKSAINFFETGQPMEIWYGYELPTTHDIEWIRGNMLSCSDWEADDYTATIRSQDIYRNMDVEYFKGSYYSSGISYYDLAVLIYSDAGLENYYVDPRLQLLFTTNPIPRVQHKEALQIIANACRCVLLQARNGQSRIESSFVPDSSVSTNGETSYSMSENIYEIYSKAEYGSFSMDYSTVDGTMFFLPRLPPCDESLNPNTGYVSESQSNEYGLFDENPILTFTLESSAIYYGIKITFGFSLPSKFVIRTYKDDSPVDELTITDNIQKNYILKHSFLEFDKMTIEFIETLIAFNRIVINHFAFGDTSEFVINRTDMMTSPKVIKQELIREIIVPCYSYQPGTQEDSLINEELTITTGDRDTFYVTDPTYDFRVELENTTGGVTIIESGSYYITVQYSVSGTYRVRVYGWRYRITERYAVESLNDRGKTIKWENPLISDMTMAADLAKWLGDYYRSGVEYEYDYRGYPEIDVNDIIYQENSYNPNMKVNVYRSKLNFNQSFSGNVVVRRVED